MARNHAKSFDAVLEAAGKPLFWVIARVPFDLKKEWPEWNSRRVRGEIGGFAFRTSLFPSSNGTGFTLLVNKKMQAGARVRPGDRVRIVLEPDLEERPVTLPAELGAALKGDRQLRKWFDALSPSMRRGLAGMVEQAKGSETRKSRAERVAETLLLAMEGEREPPPVLRAAFQRQPLAEAGWKAMTPTQRRSHLLGIFYYQTVEGRGNRAQKAAEEALRVAKRAGRRGGIQAGKDFLR